MREVIDLEAEVLGTRRITPFNYNMGHIDVCQGVGLKILKPDNLSGREIIVFLEPDVYNDPQHHWKNRGARLTSKIIRANLNDALVPIHDSLNASHFVDIRWSL